MRVPMRPKANWRGAPFRLAWRQAGCLVTLERWTRMVMTLRCLTCKAELPAGIENYCNEACQLKAGRTKRAPGRTAARRRRRRGGRKL